MAKAREDGKERRDSRPSIPGARVGTVAERVHAEEITAFLERTGHISSQGLSEDEAQRRLGVHGPNRLPEAKKKSNLLRLLQQFVNPLVLTLLAAAVIAVVVGLTSGGQHSFLGRFGDAIAILLIVVLNAFLG